MRIIGGNFRGKKILDPTDKSTRPLKDMVRESIFNIIEHSNIQNVKLNDSNVIDFFSGTGSFGIECLSRGSRKVFFFENYINSIKILEKNLNNFNVNNNFKIIKKNSYKFKTSDIDNEKIDIIFLDPPYKDTRINELLDILKNSNILNIKSIVILHRNIKTKEKLTDNLVVLKEKNYGLSKIIFGKLSG
tara:strand:+ start:1730 stop:2296 length:567 start_codon:yes stop_codon:yes gene_type:complete